ncbi:MAG: hypothetical protein PUA56_02845 [Bacillales bacterium]|nr:hypothetical protein [Bacillales bacterium]
MHDIKDVDILNIDIKKAYQENVEEYNKAVRDYQELKKLNLNYIIGNNLGDLDEQKEKYIENLKCFDDIKLKVISLEEKISKLLEYVDLIKVFCNEFNSKLERIYLCNKEGKYHQIIEILNTVDLSIFENPYHIEYLSNAEQAFYWTKVKAYSEYLKRNGNDYDAIVDYIACSKKIRVHTSYHTDKVLKKDIRLFEGKDSSCYIEDAYKFFMLYHQDKMKKIDMNSFGEFDYYFQLFNAIKEDSKNFSKNGRDLFFEYEKTYMSWFNNLSIIAFYKLKDLSLSIKLFNMTSSFNKSLIKDNYYRESTTEKEFKRYFEENILATCTKEEMRLILRQNSRNEDVSDLVNILCSSKIQIAYINEIVNELSNLLSIYLRWELVTRLIEEYKEEAHRKLIETLLNNCLRRQFISLKLPVICHYLYVAYHYSDDKNNLHKIETFAKRIFNSPKVYRCRHKLEGFEIIQIYRMSTNKPFNKKDSMYYFGSSSSVVTGEDTFRPKIKGYISFCKTMVFILMALCIISSVIILTSKNSEGVQGIYNPIAYEITGILLASISALWTFKIVYFSSDDEIGAIISRYFIVIILVIGTIIYSYLQFVRIFNIPSFLDSIFPNLTLRFNANAYNISIVSAVIGAIFNLSSYFYINKRESRFLRIFTSILTSVIAVYLIALMAYTIFTWTPPIID